MIFAGGVGPDVLRFAERQTKGRLAVHTPAGRVRRVEFRHSQRLDRRFVGPRQVRHRRAGKTGAGARAEDFRRTQQLCRLAGLAGGGGMPAQQTQQDVLGDPVVDLPRDPKRLGKPRFRGRDVARHHRHLTQIHDHGLEVVEITGVPAQPRAGSAQMTWSCAGGS